MWSRDHIVYNPVGPLTFHYNQFGGKDHVLVG